MPRVKSKLTEAQFLAAEEQATKAAMRATLADLRKDVGRGLNPLQWMRDHPWLSLIGWCIGGFATAAVVVPSKEEQALRKLRRLQEAMRPAPPKDAAEDKSKSDAAGHDGHGGWVGTLLGELFRLLRPLLISLFTTIISAHTTPPPPASAQPGPADPPSAPPV
jgi:hypothetical protein